VADPEIDGMGREEGLGVQGAEPRWGFWGRIPQKLKPKNGLDASQKAFGDVECQVCEPTLNLCIILVLVGMLQPVCRPLSLNL